MYGTYPDQKKADALKDFVKWGVMQGQKFSENLGFCTLPTHVRELGVRDIDTIK
jgi:phosphate transport system substrate-binding protein